MSAVIADERTSLPVVSHRRLWDGAVFDLDEDEVEFPSGEKARRHYLAHPGAVAVVALRPRPDASEDADALEHWEIALVDQYRHPVQATLWEIPAGLLDKEGEEPLAAAKRELWEETGLEADEWNVLVDYFTSPGASSEGLRIYLARGARRSQSEETYERTGEEAQMTLRWVRADEALAAVHAGRLHNPSAVVGILALASAVGANFAPLRRSDAPWLRSTFTRAKRPEF